MLADIPGALLAAATGKGYPQGGCSSVDTRLLQMTCCCTRLEAVAAATIMGTPELVRFIAYRDSRMFSFAMLMGVPRAFW